MQLNMFQSAMSVEKLSSFLAEERRLLSRNIRMSAPEPAAESGPGVSDGVSARFICAPVELDSAVLVHVGSSRIEGDQPAH